MHQLTIQTRLFSTWWPMPCRTVHQEGQSISSPSTSTPPGTFIQTTDTSPLSSLLGAATDTAQPHKATLPQATDTPGDTTRLSHPSPTKPNVWTTPSYGLTQASSKHPTGWTHVADMESPSTRKSSGLLAGNNCSICWKEFSVVCRMSFLSMCIHSSAKPESAFF